MPSVKPKLALTDADTTALSINDNPDPILEKARIVAEAKGMDWEAIKADATSLDHEHLLLTLDAHFNVTVYTSGGTL